MMTAVSENSGSVRARRSSVVLPLPRKPVKIVTGIVSNPASLLTPNNPPRFANPIVSRCEARPQAPRCPVADPPLSMGVVAFFSLRQHHASHNGVAYAPHSSGGARASNGAGRHDRNGEDR